MKVVHGIGALDRSVGRSFVVIGVFDGLHLGHLYLLEELRRAAAARDAKPIVITFDHHPDEILTGSAPPLLCDPEERLGRLAAAGVEVTVVETFDVALRMTPYDAFVRRIAERVDLAGFLMTPESAFGHDRLGTPETVAELGRASGYAVVVVPPFLVDGRPVSSGEIRRAIGAGRLADAERLLGRSYAVTGTVGASTSLRFAMPVAIPPPGTYRILMSSAARPSDRSREASITIGPDGMLRVDGLTRPLDESDRLRVVFVGAVSDAGRDTPDG
jgi:riboflavin kinase/FMN adenylyltransferase